LEGQSETQEIRKKQRKEVCVTLSCLVGIENSKEKSKETFKIYF
jgi:hypothetical protein